jgi:ClpP class serine protease
MTSYESIAENIDKAVSAGATDIGFYIDSPGGEVSGLFGLTSKIRSLVDSGIHTFGFTDGMATSAAYAIMAACQTCFATETAIVGSIAAIMVHMETSVADAMAGKTFTIFRSKSEKALADSHTPLDTTAIDKINTILASMDNSFNNDIALSRPNLSIQNIIDFKGSEFMAATALELGLIDKVVASLDTVLVSQFSNKQSRGISMTLEEMQTKLDALQVDKVAMEAAHAVALVEAVTAERARCTAILTAGATLKVASDLAMSNIEEGFSAETSLKIMTAVASATTMQNPISGAVGFVAAPEANADQSSVKKDTLASSYSLATGIKA